VHDTVVVETQLGVADDLPRGLEGDREHERRRGDHIRVAEGLGGLGVRVGGVRVPHGLRELTDLLPADLVRVGGRVGPPHEGLVERHRLGTSWFAAVV
jgi:hypothetical protein